MKIFFISLGLVGIFFSSTLKANSNFLYQVSYYSTEKNGDYVQGLLADWGGADLGPAKYYPPAIGGRYFYFQLDQEVVEDLFRDLSEKGDIYVERSPSPKPVPKGKVQFVIWFFPDRGDSGTQAQFNWNKGSSRASRRKDDIIKSLQSMGVTTTPSSRWKNTFWYDADPKQFYSSLASGELLNGVLLFGSGKSVEPGQKSSNLVSVRDVKSQDGEAIEETTPKIPSANGMDMEFIMLPSLPFEADDLDDFKKQLAPLVGNIQDKSGSGEISFQIELKTENLAAVLSRVAAHGLIRMTALQPDLGKKSQIKIRISWQEPDELMVSATDVMEVKKDGQEMQDKFPNEFDFLYSASQGISGQFVSALDVTARRWIRRIGIRGNYVETAGAATQDYTQLIGAHLQYRFHWKKAKYGQSVIPGLVYKQIRTSAHLGTFLGAGIAYTDDMWKPVAMFFDLVPFFRRPKTVEINAEVLPLTTNSNISSPVAYILSLKGFVNRTAKFKLIGALYMHSYGFTSKQFSNGTQVSTDTVTNSVFAMEFGVGYRF